MIRDWSEFSLYMDFSGIHVPKGHPSDIDMYYITPSGFLILGEIKNEKGTFTPFQRSLIQSIVDNHSNGWGTCLYITHKQDVHKGDKVVNVGQCYVEEYYWDGNWVIPQNPVTVNEMITRIIDWCDKDEQRKQNSCNDRRTKDID